MEYAELYYNVKTYKKKINFHLNYSLEISQNIIEIVTMIIKNERTYHR